MCSGHGSGGVSCPSPNPGVRGRFTEETMKGKVVLLGLALGVLVSTQAFAQSDLGLKQVGMAIGYVSPEDIDGTFTFGALMNWGTIAPRIELESRVDYWSH